MGQSKFNDYFNPKNAITIVILVGAILGFFALKKAFGKSKKQKQQEAEADQDIIDAVDEAKIEQKKTLSEAQLIAMAKAIKSAWGGIWNDDEDAVYAQFSKLNNYWDLMALIQQYGLNKGRTLEEDIRNRMSNKEVEELNKILKIKGIQFTI